MPTHPDILDVRESLARPFAGSLAAHALVFGTVALYGALTGAVRERWGDPNSLGGGSVGITPVSQIPVPSQGGLANPVANDTESRVPAPPKPKAARQTKEPEPEAIAIRGRRQQKRRSDVAAQQSRFRAQKEERPNQLYSSTGQAMSSTMFGTTTGSGGVGTGTGSPFGTRFGFYERLLREKVARAWRTDGVDPRLQTAPPVIVSFEILRDGSVRNLRVLQRSGDVALDNSAQRAILTAQPFDPLPFGFERNSATVEFWFQLKR